jgi:hypothetical protein
MSSYNLVANARAPRASTSSYDQSRRILVVKVDGIQRIVELNARALNRWRRHECAVSVTLGWSALLHRGGLQLWNRKAAVMFVDSSFYALRLRPACRQGGACCLFLVVMLVTWRTKSNSFRMGPSATWPDIRIIEPASQGSSLVAIFLMTWGWTWMPLAEGRPSRDRVSPYRSRPSAP